MTTATLPSDRKARVVSLAYNPVAVLPGLITQRHHAVPRLDVFKAGSWMAFRPASQRTAPNNLLPLSEFVMTNALTGAVSWYKERQWRRPDVSVRLTVEELTPPTVVVEVLERALHIAGLNPGLVTIEVAPAPAVTLARIQATLCRLKDLGVRMSYSRGPAPCDLDEFWFDEVQICLSSGGSAQQADSICAFIDGAKQRGMAVLARGVSTGGQLMTAYQFGATHIQGAFAGSPTTDASAVLVF